jgi:hypothetical protein
VQDNDLAVGADGAGTSDDRPGGLKERLGRQDTDDGKARDGPRYFKEGRNGGDLEEVTPTQIAGKRIGQLTAKLSEERLARSSLEASVERIQNLLNASTANANTLYESAVKGDLDGGKADLERIQGDLKKAIDDGDTERQAKLTIEVSQATTKVAQAQTEKERIEQHKARQAADPNATRRAADTNADTRQQDALSPKAQAWVEANPWFDENSDEYDEDRHDIAILEHNRLLKSGVKGGSDAYFEQLNTRLKSKFAALGNGNVAEADLDDEMIDRKTNGNAFALPANRGAGNDPPRGSKALIRLSAEQRAVARALQQPEAVYALGVMLGEGRITEEDYQARYAEYAKKGLVK